MIELENLSRRYGSVRALNHVTLKAEKGTVLGLLGQNGAGKTTLLNLMTGYLAPTEGRALIGGFDPLLQPEEARRLIGYLPEQPPLYDEMTVEEYLCFAAKLRDVVSRAVLPHVREIEELTGLTAVKDRIIGHLSKGFRQRTGFAQALCGDPEILILDEPTVGLDPKQVTEIRALIRDLSREKTIVFSSHILSEVQQLCTRAVILHQGEVCLDTPLGGADEEGGAVLLLRAEAPVKTILPRLKALSGVQEVSVQSGDGAFSAEIAFSGNPQPEKAVFSLMREMNLPILHLSRRENNLEEIFLKVISR